MTEIEQLESALEESATLATSSTLAEIAALARQALAQTRAVQDAEGALKRARAALDSTLYVDLPSAMTNAGLASFATDDGTVVSVKSAVYASITEAKKAAAFAWLRSHGFGDLIKAQAVLQLGDQDAAAHAALLSALEDVALRHGVVAIEEKASVHPSTLKAFAKEQLASGEFPTDLFGVFVRQEASIKAAKAAK